MLLATGAQLCVTIDRLPTRAAVSNIENIVKALVMVGPILGVRLLSVYRVTVTSGRELDVYCVLAVTMQQLSLSDFLCFLV